MGRLSVNEVETLRKKGILPDATVKEMQDEGLVSKRSRITARWIKTKGNTWVSPQLYFQGLNKSEYSKDMTTFRGEFDKLVVKYCTTKPTTTK